MAALAGKTCLVFDDGSAVATSVVEAVRAAGGAVIAAAVNDRAKGRGGALDLTERSDAAWSAVLSGAGAPAINAPRINCAINVAIPSAGGAVGKTSADEFRAALEASYDRSFLALKFAIPLLRQSNGGAFVTITSADFVTGAPAATARCAAANGIVLMTRSAALECAGKGDNVRVNAVIAGDILARAESRLGPGHAISDELAATAVYLISDAASYITGLILPVDNGRGRA
ncbi:MAG: SDR family oxidoreductase [Rhodospirillaceae bacterium]|nr:SDR family oxidoreductase [Rhodospirillaceae bacterium]